MDSLIVVPEVYAAMSREEIEANSNGCGPQGWRGDIVNSLNYLIGLDVSEPCRVHDILYGIGGTEEDRLRADVILYVNMAALVLFAGGPLVPFRMVEVVTMYKAVRAGGAEHFGKGN